jgi:putative tryptophan/tyrosine transport system substrate-binding protein
MWSRGVGLIMTLILSLLATPLATDAQQAGKIPQVGFLLLGSPDSYARAFAVFRQALHEFGYVEGQNIVFEYRWAEGADQFSNLAAELVQRRVDVIVAPSTPAIHAAKQATTTIPIVILSVGDPVAARLVETLARPGGNITGITGPITGAFCGKMLELLKEAVPGIARVAVLGAPTAHAHYLRETAVTAQLLGVQLHPIELQGPDALESAFETATDAGADALLLLPTVFFTLNERRIAALAVQSRLPAIFWRRSFAAVGGLMAYGPRSLDLWRRAAALAGRILQGTKPADLPVEQAMHFELVINLKTAQALGLTIPPMALFQADEVIRDP